MKNITYIFRTCLILLLGMGFFLSQGINTTLADEPTEYIDEVGSLKVGNLDTSKITSLDANNSVIDTDKLDTFGKDSPKFIKSEKSGARQIAIFLARIGKDLKNIFFSIAFIYFLVITLKLLLSGNSEEAIGNFKKGILWITIGLIIMQIAFSLTVNLFDKNVNGDTAINFVENILYPLINLLSTLASLFFIAICVYAFYRLITANGEEEKAKSAKMTIFYGILGFIIIRVSDILVKSFYGKTACEYNMKVDGTNPNQVGNCTGDLSGVSSIIFTMINWLNSFVALIVVIMIIYVGAQVMTSNGDEEKLKKAKKALLYIFIGILVLVLNYFILTFGLLDSAGIPTQ